MDFEPGLAVRTRIKADRIDEFERWVQEVLTQLRQHAPEAPALRLFREWPADEAGDAPVEYMLFAAGNDLPALDLEPLLDRIYGPEQGQAELSRFESMLAGEQDVWELQRIEA